MDYYTHIYNGDLDLYRGTEPARVEGYCTDLFADDACDFLRRNAGRPFFLYLPFNAPHFPNPRNLRPGEKLEWQVPEKYLRLYGHRPNEEDPKKRYRAVVTALDDGFGRVLRQIDTLDLASRTLVIFFSDNGAFMLPGRGLEVASNAPLRDGGVTCWEGGIRVPGAARWPGKLPGGRTCDEMLWSPDLLPMILSAAGAPPPSGVRLDGRDPTAALTGKAASPHRALCFEYQKYQAVRSGKWKLIRIAPDQPWQLFDLDRDIGETTNLAARRPDLAKKLAAEFAAWRRDVASG
jgi:arylsulfatase A-like enzyme